MAKQEDEKTAGSAEAKEAPGGSRFRRGDRVVVRYVDQVRGTNLVTHQNTDARIIRIHPERRGVKTVSVQLANGIVLQYVPACYVHAAAFTPRWTYSQRRLLSDIFPWLKRDDYVLTDTVDISETSPWLHEEHDGPRDTIESDPEQHKGETR